MRVAVFSLFWLGAVISGWGAVVTVNPTADTFVSSANSTSNYGEAGAMSVSASGLPKGEFDSLLKFDLAPVKLTFDQMFGVGKWVINGISLQFSASVPNNSIFNGNGVGSGGSNVNLAGNFTIKWMANDTWVEGTGKPNQPTDDGITFATLGTYLSGSDVALGTFSFNGATTGNNVWNLNLASSLVTDAAGGHLVTFFVGPASSTVSYTFNSRDFMMPSNYPVLTISAIPEPGVPLSGALGALMLASRRRRRDDAGPR